MLSFLVWNEYSHLNSLKNKYHLFCNTEDPHSTSFGFLGVWRNVYLAVFLHRCIQVRKRWSTCSRRGRGLMGSMSPERLLKYWLAESSKLKCDNECRICVPNKTAMRRRAASWLSRDSVTKPTIWILRNCSFLQAGSISQWEVICLSWKRSLLSCLPHRFGFYFLLMQDFQRST